ncbi:MAG: hypothetical protein CL910_09680 [Deltaproteobacteria bacterium]|jgi:hypothetical protein|nr:hypothetical protein [Deltaproteobacteria bacterium]
MGRATVTQAMNAPADAVWQLISDFGDTSWMPGGTPVELEGEGPGMARIIVAGPDTRIREQLESLDPASRTLVYTIPEGVPFPVTGYRSTMVVEPTDEGSNLTWSCEFEADGVSEAEAQAAIEQMYGVMAGWVRDRVV